MSIVPPRAPRPAFLTMPRRKRPPTLSPPDLPDAVRAALLSAEIPPCDCKLTLTPSCLVGAEAACRERRTHGTCPCRPRWLPACQLDHPGGCGLRREGKPCSCGRRYMPSCLSPGCDLRQRGRLCECPRWPGPPCPHLTARANRLRMLAACYALQHGGEGTDPDSVWALLLWQLQPDQYADREPPGAGADLADRRARVEMMALRNTLGVGLWHPSDRRHPAGTELNRLAASFRNFGMQLGSEGGAA